MKDTEETLKAFWETHKAETKTSRSLDERLLEKALQEQNTTHRVPRTSGSVSWRQLMKQKRTWISAAAAVLVVALILTFAITPKTYAVADTLEAMKGVHTVSFKAFLYKQQTEVECQMRFSDRVAKPTHIRLYFAGAPYHKIDNEHGSFAYNATTNRFRRIRRDERHFNWYPDFRQLFNRALTDAATNNQVRIGQAIESNTKQAMIVLDVNEIHREVRYWIDPESKLPTRFTTVKTHNLQHLRRQTIAARDIWDIRYNDVFPENTFTIPADAEEVFEEIDTFVTPGMGMPVGNLTDFDACIKIIRDCTDALNALDFETARKLHFPLGIPPKEVLEQLTASLVGSDEPLIQLLSHEEPYEEGPYWYVRCKVKDIKKGEQEDLVRIRFFEFDGVRSCIIAMPD